LAAVGDHERGGDHAGRVDADGFDMSLRAPVEMDDADGRGDVGPGDAGEESGGRGIFGALFDDVRADAGRQESMAQPAIAWEPVIRQITIIRS
jgi:hypothetical protein